MQGMRAPGVLRQLACGGAERVVTQYVGARHHSLPQSCACSHLAASRKRRATQRRDILYEDAAWRRYAAVALRGRPRQRISPAPNFICNTALNTDCDVRRL